MYRYETSWMHQTRAIATSVLVCTLSATLWCAGTAWAQCDGAGPDNLVAQGEQCDDGNNLPGDGCDAICNIEQGYACVKPLYYSDVVIDNLNEALPSQDKGNWEVAPNGLSALQLNNNETGTMALFGTDSQVATYKFVMRAEDVNDDDTMGFVLGFDEDENEGDGSAIEYLVVDWQKNSQVFEGAGEVFLEGMRLVHVTGRTNNVLFDSSPNTRVLTRANSLADTGWAAFFDNQVEVNYRSDSLRVLINGVVEFDVTPADFPDDFPSGVFPGGDIGFYARSLENVRFRVSGDTSSTCNNTSVADSTVTVPTGTANVALNVGSVFSDSEDSLDPNNISVVSVEGGGSGRDPSDGTTPGTVVFTPNDANAVGTYRVTVVACDDNAEVVACDEAVFTVEYVPADAIQSCNLPTDCPSGICKASDNVCAPQTCISETQDGDETDVDCGGSCEPCEAGQACAVNGDCDGSDCVNAVCDGQGGSGSTDGLRGFSSIRGSGGSGCSAGARTPTGSGVLWWLGGVLLFLGLGRRSRRPRIA